MRRRNLRGRLRLETSSYQSSCREVKALEEELADIVTFDRRLRDLDLKRAPLVEMKKNLGVEDGD